MRIESKEFLVREIRKISNNQDMFISIAINDPVNSCDFSVDFVKSNRRNLLDIDTFYL